jgi:hypothetical protein
VLRYQNSDKMFLGYTSNSENAAAALVFFDKDGKRRIYMGFSDAGVPNITIYAPDGRMVKQLGPQ